MAHRHNENGTVREYDTEVGPEVVTYRMVKCTCGQVTRIDIVARRPK